jgi:pheromone shutdown protein TraB
MFPKHKNEFRRIIEKINPNQILVEIDREINLKSSQIKKYPKEMIFSYNWAVKNNKQVDVFDTNRYKQIKKTATKKDLDEATKIFLKMFKNYDWKQMNQRLPSIEEYRKIERKVLNLREVNARRKVMLSNIRRLSIKKGSILIVTGASHLDFFEKNIKGAIFPFRQ